ncbi:hypothetical protein EVAR_11234_1 [Eumeta japonica]|uniref:Uncharacterized protein n=1 Tax=Eumeta variegata TaxID=151549 RepID=A0A4C1UKM2_EUMVA|nr:hypothetical protein EVAR_11234_1 [Eumeta japonica]
MYIRTSVMTRTYNEVCGDPTSLLTAAFYTKQEEEIVTAALRLGRELLSARAADEAASTPGLIRRFKNKEKKKIKDM